VAQTIAPVGFTVPLTVGTPTVTNPVPQTIAPAGFQVPVSFGTASVDLGPSPQTIQPVGFQVPISFGAPTVVALGQTIAPAGFQVPVTMGTPLVTGGTQAIVPFGFVVPVTFGVAAISGGAAASGPQPPPPGVVVVRPPLELAVEIVAADGTQYRWTPVSRAERIPQGISFKTKRAEGFADASLTLARRIDRDYVDLRLLDSVVISGHDGSIAYEGRVAALPRSMQATHSLSVQAVGWMAHARDRKLQEIYVDRDLGAWQPMSSARRAALLAASPAYSIFDPSARTDDGGMPSVSTTLSGTWANRAANEAWYDAGAGLKIAAIYYDWAKSPSIDPANTNWFWLVYVASTAAAAALEATSNLRAASSTPGYFSPSARYRYAVLQLDLEAPVGAGADYEIQWRRPAVYGDHNVPLIGDSDPKGVAASDVIKHVVGKYCPKLNTAGVQRTTYPIPQLAFKDRTDPYDAFLEVNKYHLWQLAVYENRTLSFQPVDMSDYGWEVRLSDPGVTVDLQGDSTETLANGIVVSYQDLTTGTPNVVTPDDHPELRDPGDSNPATLQGLKLWTEIQLSSPTDMAGALQIGRAALAEYNQPKSPGTITVKGHIRDRAGHWQQAWKPRAGDRIIIADHANDRPRLVVETDYSDDTKTVSIAVDSSFKRLDAVLDRFGTALRASGLT
jgi:hypothetical protein